MTNAPKNNSQSPEDVKIFSENLPQLIDALECLYVFDNIGGRLQFLEQYPDTANYIFPPDLLHVDQTGTKDKEQRLKLEKSAEENRARLLENITTIQNKYKHEQDLTPADIEKFIQELGREIGLRIFDPAIIDRFLPPPPPEPAEKAARPKSEPIPNHKKPDTTPPDINPISTTPPPKKFAPNLAKPRTLIHAEPPGSNVLSYQGIVKNAETPPNNPRKNQYSMLFNAIAL